MLPKRNTQENRAIIDYDSPMICGTRGVSYCSRAAGKVRSEGVELEARGQLTQGWQVSGGYTWNKGATGGIWLPVSTRQFSSRRPTMR